MALTRKFLAAMSIDPEKIDEIINAHADTVDALKEERDKAKRDAEEYKTAADKLEAVEKELKDAKSLLNGANPFEEKYVTAQKELEKLQNEFDGYKRDVEEKAQHEAKRKAYSALLEEAGVSRKRIDSVLKVTDLNGVEVGKDGTLKDKERLINSIKDEWADFIETEVQKGANTPTPQVNNASGNLRGESRAARLAAKYHNNLYGETKEA